MPANLFDLSQYNDQSLYYLGQIFGPVGGVLPALTENPILEQLFLTLNTIALTVGAIIVIYTTVVGLMMTAHEGEFLGKKWSGLWVPIRMVLGVASLFPAPAYSIIQVVIMWFIIQGIGAADMVWSAVIKGSKGETVQDIAEKSSASSMTTKLFISDLFKGLVCEETLVQAQSLSVDDIKTVKTSITNYDPNSKSYKMGPKGACGELKTCSNCDINDMKSDASCSVCQAQRTVLPGIITDLRSFASPLAKADVEYIRFYKTPGGNAQGWIKDYCDDSANGVTNCCVTPYFPGSTPSCSGDKFVLYKDPNAPSSATMSKDELQFILDYNQTIKTLLKSPDPASPDKLYDFISVMADRYTDEVKKLLPDTPPTASDSTPVDDMAKYGWITAGAYYYDVIKLTQSNLQAVTSTPMVVDPAGDVLPSSSIEDARNNYKSATDLLQRITGMASSNTSGVPAPPTSVSNLSNPMTDASSVMMDDFMNNLTSNSGLAESGTEGNAFTNVAVFGQNLLIIAQVMYALTLTTMVIAAFAAAWASWTTLGTGAPTSPASELFKAFFGIFGPMFFALLGALFSFGALLGMYVPMIPFVVFTASVIGWFIAVIEAMVAAPIVALGILSPGGQSEVFGRAEPSVMIIFNLFLRPSLMVTGLVMAMFLANVVISFINFGFLYVMGSVMNLNPGMVENVIFIAIYVSMIFTSMNQVFTLIHHIPERILTYIGGQAMQYGEAQAAQATKQAVEGAGAGMAGGMKGGVEGGAAGAGTAAGVAKKAGMDAGEKGSKWKQGGGAAAAPPPEPPE